jgi:hypothetical protein
MQVQEWLGRTIKEDRVEISGMVWLFYQWVEQDSEALAEVPSSWTDSWRY